MDEPQIRNLPWVIIEPFRPFLVVPFAFGLVPSSIVVVIVASCSASEHFASSFVPAETVAGLAFATFALGLDLHSCPYFCLIF